MIAPIARQYTTVATPRLSRSISNIISRSDKVNVAATPAAVTNAPLSTSAATKAAVSSASGAHVQSAGRKGRVTSVNRTFHHTASWDAGSDLVGAKSNTALRQQEKLEAARLRRYKGAVEML